MNRDTDRWVRSDEARAKLRDLLDELARDGDAAIYLLRYDKPAAVLVPVDWYERTKAAQNLSAGLGCSYRPLTRPRPVTHAASDHAVTTG